MKHELQAFSDGSFQDIQTAYASKKAADIPWNFGAASIRATQLITDGTIRPGSKILDIGCGLGDHSIFFALNQMHVTGIDIMKKSIKMASKNASVHRAKVDWIVGDALHMELEDDFFDVAYDHLFFHNLKKSSRAPFVKEIDRVLKNGGIYTMTGFSDKMAKGSGPHRLTSREIIHSLHPYFNCEHLEFFTSLPIKEKPRQVYWFSIWRKTKGKP